MVFKTPDCEFILECFSIPIWTWVLQFYTAVLRTFKFFTVRNHFNFHVLTFTCPIQLSNLFISFRTACPFLWGFTSRNFEEMSFNFPKNHSRLREQDRFPTQLPTIFRWSIGFVGIRVMTEEVRQKVDPQVNTNVLTVVPCTSSKWLPCLVEQGHDGRVEIL